MSLRTRFTLGLVATAVVASTAGLAAASSPVEAAAPALGEYAAGRVLVKFAPGVDHASQTALEHGFGARELSSIDALGVRVLSVPGIRDAVVNLVWDPPWDPSKMSDEARLELGML